jgi:hypothetical protein
MHKTVLYFHGFKSTSNSQKAISFKKNIIKKTKKTKIIIPNLHNEFDKAHEQINKLIQDNNNIVFMGSSLGGYYASYFAQKNSSKAVLINPAIPPLHNFEEFLGENANYDTGEKFNITKQDIDFLRSLHFKRTKKPKNFLILLESKDEILNYISTIEHYKGSFFDILFGGNHSFASFEEKIPKIISFFELA